MTREGNAARREIKLFIGIRFLHEVTTLRGLKIFDARAHHGHFAIVHVIVNAALVRAGNFG